MRAVFVTGTDTDVGKTVAAAWLCENWQANYWKPIQSGLSGGTDSEALANLSSCKQYPERHLLTEPLSPHASAEIDGVNISLSDFTLPPEPKKLVVEGAGGLLVPINARDTVADLVGWLKLPIIIVARSGLGTINHTCLTIEAARLRNLHVLGVIMTGPPNPLNKRAIEHYGNTSVMAEIPHLTPLNRAALLSIPMSSGCKAALDGHV